MHSRKCNLHYIIIRCHSLESSLLIEAFIDDIEHFKDRVADLDRRLGRIANQAFVDCNGLESMYKLIHIFGSLIERPIIHHDFAHNYVNCS